MQPRPTTARPRRQAVAPIPLALPVEQVVGGVDTHADTHTAAVVDLAGRMLAHATFPTTATGYADLLEWMASHTTSGDAGAVVRVGIEGTGSYGAGLARHLRDLAGVEVVEVDRPDRRTRRLVGKSDPIDAEAAARAALSGRAAGIPKTRTGPVEAIRALRVARGSAVSARARAIVQMKSLIISAPELLREQLREISTTHSGTAKLVRTCAALRPDPARTRAGDPCAATKTALRALARRHQHLCEEITDLDDHLAAVITTTAPTLLAAFGVGPDIAGQLLTTAGDNPQRLHCEAAFAALCGASPVPASSGKTTGAHRLNRGGDRHANCALYRVVITRLRYDERTRAYATRRSAQGLSKKKIIRCLKRYVARELYHLILTDTTTPRPT